MAAEPLWQRSRLAERAWRIANHLIVAGLLACAAWPVVQIAQRIAPGYEGGYLVTAAALVALEAMLAERLSQSRGGGLGMWLIVARAAEVAVLLLLVRLVQVARAAAGSLWAGATALILRLLAQARGETPPAALALPSEGLLTPEFMFAAGLLFLVWILAGWFASGLLAMEGDEFILRDETRNLGLAAERSEARRQMRAQVFSLGAVVVALTAVLRADLSRVGVVWAPFTGGLLNLVLYFALGLLLLGQSRFAGLRLQWAWERVAVRPGLAWGWAGYSLALFLLVAVVVSFLPTHYSLGLLDVIAGLIGLVGQGLYLLSLLILVPLGLLWGWLQRLVNPAAPSAPPTELLPPALPTLPPQAPADASSGGGWTAWSQSLIFWLLFLGTFALSFFVLVKQRPEFDQLGRRLTGVWPWLAARWRALAEAGRWLGGEAVRLAQAGLVRLRPRSAAPPSPWRYLNLRRLTPRDRVRFYYRALLRRGREAGLPRRPGETPLEYEQELAQALPEAGTPLSDLTDEFLEAQYSQHPIPPARAEAARQRWEAVRRALRLRQAAKAHPTPGPDQAADA